MEKNRNEKHLSLFNRFLKERGIFDIFYENSRNCKSKGPFGFKIPSPPKSKLEFLTLISHGFNWSETRQGYEYWYNIEKDWMKFISIKYRIWNERF